MRVAPLSALSSHQAIMDGRDAVMVSRLALEALLRPTSPGVSLDDLTVASYYGPGLSLPLTADDILWLDEPVNALRCGSEYRFDTETSAVDIQWFDDVAQAIDSGAISETPLSLADRPC